MGTCYYPFFLLLNSLVSSAGGGGIIGAGGTEMFCAAMVVLGSLWREKMRERERGGKKEGR